MLSSKQPNQGYTPPSRDNILMKDKKYYVEKQNY